MTQATVEAIGQPQVKPTAQWLGLGFLVAVIAFVIWLFSSVINWMSDEQRLPLSHLVVEGQLYQVTPQEVKTAVLNAGSLNSFMLQDVNVIQYAIESLPWVASAAVRKQWPDTLKVHITEHQAAAIWNGKKLLTHDATVFPANPEDVSSLNLVSLHGMDETSEEVLQGWKDMQQVLDQIDQHVEALSLNERRSWRIITREGLRLELGREARLERLERFVDIYPQIMAQGKVIDYVDLRYDTGAAIGWKSEHSTDSED